MIVVKYKFVMYGRSFTWKIDWRINAVRCKRFLRINMSCGFKIMLTTQKHEQDYGRRKLR
jgi:hypothetical protein